MIDEASLTERRRHPRLENNVPVKICQEDGDIVTETRNISRAGVYCRVQKPLGLMTKLKIHLLLPSQKNAKITTKKVSCQGVVVRTEPIKGEDAYYAAIFFNEISPKEAEYISEYVHAHMRRGEYSDGK